MTPAPKRKRARKKDPREAAMKFVEEVAKTLFERHEEGICAYSALMSKFIRKGKMNV